MEYQSVNKLFEESFKENWEREALSNYQGITLKYSDVAERIERGYKLFFRNRKHHVKSAPPSFRKRSRYRSFTLKQCGYKYDGGNRVRIGKQSFRFFKSREIEGEIRTVY